MTKHRKDNNILLTAIHGGGIEPGTTELARRVSNVGKYNFYSLKVYVNIIMINFT